MSERRWPAIDLVKLYTTCSHAEWNRRLSIALINQDVVWLQKTLYGVQAGMADLASQGMNSPKMNEWFIRISRSIEQTAKQLFRRKYPSPLDNPLRAREFLSLADAKRVRDQAFDQFIRESSY